ncbi:tetratricopeptide (TPR) repeat protein [Amycolatopsis bartoniae]|uniref:Tetratricopeptide repeat protein n=1 Tax=Amycolatopsis bartoniae TaxID=941986 RepID=A0A8H9ITK3_9PSEU|nr:hypothetical protein [Amycolatopsis bartoniae]MBB2933264.1 tetratricopeptide (TPR) repeat protein [Amycolatopsis bartoniae]GHF58257.1 hypothetical protein GCM10017566_34480 [Amycolatopsis bartoniae]
MLEEPVDDVSEALQELVRTRLATEPEEDRYLLSGLVRRHARTKVPNADEVLDRFLDHYLARTVAAAVLLMPDRTWHRTLLPPVVGTGDPSSAQEWLDAESGNVRAAVEAAYRFGRLGHVCLFAVGLWPYHQRGGHAQDMAAVNELGVRAAGHRGDDLCHAVLACQLGFAHLQRGDADRAIEVLRDAREVAARTGNSEIEATAIESLGLAHLARGDAAAGDLLRRNLELALELGDERRLALARFHLAKAVPPREALSLLAEATAGLRKEPENLAKIDLWRARKLRETGEHAEAERALARVLETGQYRERGEALVERAELAVSRGETDHARADLNEALELFRRRGLTSLAGSTEARLTELG